MLSVAEVAEHDSRRSCWVIIHGHVYDLTDFLESHPGGPDIILRYAGQDATRAFEPLHPPGTIEQYLTPEKDKGPVETKGQKLAEPLRKYIVGDPIPLNLCMRLDDFERAAKLTITERAYVYYHSAAEDCHTLKSNREHWSKILLRPRMLVNVSKVDMTRRIMDHDSALPFFIAPAAMARLAHPDGEFCLVRGAAKYNIPYCVSTYSSVPHEELFTCLKDLQSNRGHRGVLLLQLYANKDMNKTRKLVREAGRKGFKGLLITVDTAVGGKREEDEFFQAKAAYEAGDDTVQTQTYATPGEERPILRGAHSITLNWDDIEWIRKEWGDAGPIYLKGIQTAEDAKLALEANVRGIYLSNHGGRQLDTGSSSLLTLLEIRKFCPEVLEQMEVYLDGGIRRGSDVIKALCLGATAVGLGRTFMYALGAYGTDGVTAAIQMLSDEVESTLRLMGVTKLAELNEDYVNTTALETELPQKLRAFSMRSKI